ncbi:DUF58 domain-containing protein [Herbidospora mongoliensis]|uniref:DUF58 domain-containing protein n=1 Tax=Herbidospora mongoliensis TaxID=688067 RepID=UPI0008305E3A|nr:DUF58 domain-containing protein [Herbidospora mongoliensis]
MVTPPDRLLRRLEWRLGRRLDGRLQGAYRTVWRGAGIDFTDLRGYLPEDDVRHIDWNVTARLDEPFVRLYTEDREMTAWLVVDRSASMRAGKTRAATELAVSIARIVSRGGNKIGAILYDTTEHRLIPPRSGRDQVLRITKDLMREPARSKTVTDLAGMLRLAAASIRQRSLVVVMSDFIGDPGWEKPLGMLTHRHEVVVVRIVDPAELELPDLGLIVVEDAETGEQLLVDSSDPLLRDRLAAQVSARETELAAAMRRAGVDAHHVTTDHDLVATLLRLVRGRRAW